MKTVWPTQEAEAPSPSSQSWWSALLRTLGSLDETPGESLARQVEAMEQRLRSLEAQNDQQREQK